MVTRMRHRRVLCLTLLLLPTMFLLPCCSQAPPTTEAALAQYGISNTIPALRAALKNPNPNVRGIAAGVLAEDKDLGAIPLLREALEKERVQSVKVTLAGALATLKEWQGGAFLIKTCNDKELDATTKLMAANKLLDLGGSECLPAVVNILGQEPDPPSRELGLEYLRRTTSAPAALSPRIRAILSDALRDPTPINRQYAGECLSVLGDRDSIPALESAITVEKDLPTRLHLEENLKRLKARLG
jgi:HEAT repeat protein